MESIDINVLEILTLLGGMAASVAGGVWFISNKFGVQEATLKSLSKRMDDFHDRLITIEGKSNDIFKSQSPISLTDEGDRLLSGSGLKKYINEHKDRLIENANILGSTDTPYDIQTTSFDLIDDLDFDPEFEKELKAYAYNNGISMDVLRRIGGIYFRDISLNYHKDKLGAAVAKKPTPQS